jgi:dTDP-4-dehydrorhamnose reductase
MEEPINKFIKILVTGAKGQLGRCLQDVAIRFPNYDFHFKSSTDLDITSKAGIETLFESEKFDYCINCAAYTAVDKAETDQEKAFLVNAEAVKYLAEGCKEHKTILIHISTDFVFDGAKRTPYTEEDIPNPKNVYGASKLKGEHYVQEILEHYFIIRTSWVYSEYGHNFVKTMLRLGAL